MNTAGEAFREAARLAEQVAALKAALHALAIRFHGDSGCLGRDCPACRAMEMVKD